MFCMYSEMYCVKVKCDTDSFCWEESVWTEMAREVQLLIRVGLGTS